MTIEEMKARKTELGYTNEQIAELSKVPLGTVQKIFGGETRSPRYDTVQKLVKVLGRDQQYKDFYEEQTESEQMTSYIKERISGYGLEYANRPVKGSEVRADRSNPKPPRKVIGIADGKFKIPHDEMFFDDEICDMFEDI